MLLLTASAAFVLGLYAGSFLAAPVWAAVPLAALSLPLMFLFRRNRPLLLACLAVVGFSGGIARYGAVGPLATGLEAYLGQRDLALEGVVVSDPEPRGGLAQFHVAVQGVNSQGVWEAAQGKILVRAAPSEALVEQRRPPYFRYGDLLRLQGRLEAPPKLEDFDYRSYLARQGVSAILSRPGVELLEQGKGLAFLEGVYTVRHRLAEALQIALPEPQAALAEGILLGLRTAIPKDLLDDFTDTGTTHILAISGLNITVVAAMLLGLAVWLFGRGSVLSLVLPGIAIWLYSFLSGFDPPVVRATIMGSLYLWAMHVGRQSSGGIGLATAAAAMAALDPQILWDVSFQLSVLAMVGLIYLAPKTNEALLRWLPASLREWPPVSMVTLAVAVSVASIVATAPLIAAQFHRISLVGLPATLLALPALPWIMVTSFVTSVAGVLWPGFGEALGWLAWLGLSYLEWVVRAFAVLPLASISTGSFNQAFLWASYVVLWLLTVLWHRPRWLRRLGLWVRDRGISVPQPALPRVSAGWMTSGLGAVAALVWIAALAPSEDRLRVLFLSSGSGEVVLVQTPGGQRILLDGGSSPERLEEALGKRLPFWDRSLDVAIATRSDDAHLSGLAEVMRRHSVGVAMDSGFDATSVAALRWRRAVEESKTTYLRAYAGQRLSSSDGVVLEVLHPPHQGDSPTNEPVVLQLGYGNMFFLLTSGLSRTGEMELLAEGAPLAATVLKVADQGRSGSTSEEFLDAVRPTIAIVLGVGQRDIPDRRVLERLRRYVPTQGIFLVPSGEWLELSTDGSRLWMKKP